MITTFINYIISILLYKFMKLLISDLLFIYLIILSLIIFIPHPKIIVVISNYIFHFSLFTS